MRELAEEVFRKIQNSDIVDTGGYRSVVEIYTHHASHCLVRSSEWVNINLPANCIFKLNGKLIMLNAQTDEVLNQILLLLS